MKKLLYLLAVITLMIACKPKENKKNEEITDQTEKTVDSLNDEGWVTLFDGKSFDNWRGYLMDSMANGWTIEDGAMIFTPGVNGRNNIITKKQYTNFILSLDWKIAEAGNSGIFWGIYEDPKYPEPYESGPEIQVLDNIGHPDGKVGGKTHQAGALYDMIPPSADVCNPVGEWNHCMITIDYNNNKGSVELNGTEIVTFPVQGEQWDTMVTNSKFKDWLEFGKHHTGYIGLQDHGSKVWFKNIKIKEL